MKIIEQEAIILGDQEPGIIGMKKRIELCARLCYKTEDRITEDSYEKFVDMLYNRGHWNALSLGTVYLRVSYFNLTSNSKLSDLLKTTPYTRYVLDNGFYNITTNYRIICQLELYNEMSDYWCEPNEKFHHRVTGKFICSRSTANQLVRHRAFCMLQESQRYVNYNKLGDVGFIIPSWAYTLRDKYSMTFDPVTGETHEYINHYTGEEMWKELIFRGYDLVKKRDEFWKLCENEYKQAISDGLKPEDARGVLCNDTKTELYMCGYITDWTDSPKEDTKEKFGFFYLRTAKDAQADVRNLVSRLSEQFTNEVKYGF